MKIAFILNHRTLSGFSLHWCLCIQLISSLLETNAAEEKYKKKMEQFVLLQIQIPTAPQPLK